ncbi:hypothetical protein F7725_003708 [Dissostichus mawsoni]|uniref:Uncharacterized protein n=1 Tax=Dissostichus mawsoni TaxID=36200 RepID=A0A7J5YB28_DISMA|nr:hypothetical protein F7725_003708 [Dissostichus mawsoni]
MYLTLQATRPSMLCNQYKSLRSLKAADFHSYRHLNLKTQACLTMPAVLDGMEPQRWSESPRRGVPEEGAHQGDGCHSGSMPACTGLTKGCPVPFKELSSTCQNRLFLFQITSEPGAGGCARGINTSMSSFIHCVSSLGSTGRDVRPRDSLGRKLVALCQKHTMPGRRRWRVAL